MNFRIRWLFRIAWIYISTIGKKNLLVKKANWISEPFDNPKWHECIFHTFVILMYWYNSWTLTELWMEFLVITYLVLRFKNILLVSHYEPLCYNNSLIKKPINWIFSNPLIIQIGIALYLIHWSGGIRGTVVVRWTAGQQVEQLIQHQGKDS